MNRNLLLLLPLALLTRQPLTAINPDDVKPVKNLIVLISDGTSLSTLSLARWMQLYQDSTAVKLNIDPYLCGTVRTNCSDAPIGDSAPTTSCYMTGHASRSGYVATFPPSSGEADIESADPSRAYSPAATIAEAARQLQNKSVGIVVNSIFTDATPSDCSSHYYDRSAYALLAEQQVKNHIDVLIGGGNRYLTSTQEAYLRSRGYSVVRNDLQALRTDPNPRLWALFGYDDKDFEIDRDTTAQPSLREATEIALRKLSENSNGFFLMVEGSLVDYAAHDNDLAALWREFLAFDDACGAALRFAEADGETAVVILADHSTGGINIGSYRASDYSHLTKAQLFEPLLKQTVSISKFARLLNQAPRDSAASLFLRYEGFLPTPAEDSLLDLCPRYTQSRLPESERRLPSTLAGTPLRSLGDVAALIVHSHLPYYSWATYGHTGEDVFLAAYHPASTLPVGMNTNVEIAHYLQALLGLYGRMDSFTDSIFAPHDKVFARMECTIDEASSSDDFPTLRVVNPSNHKQLTVTAFGNSFELTAGDTTRTVELPSVMPYVDRTRRFYLPASLQSYLE